MSPADEARGVRPLRILLAEDSALCRELAAEMLRSLGHEVEAVEDGCAAADRATSGPAGFDLVLMDLELPGMDGCEATAVVRARETAQGLPRVPIYAMTGHDGDDCRSRCLAAGMDGHLAKPVRPEMLEALLARVACPRAASVEMDWSAARRAVRGNEELLRRMVGLFLEEAPRLIGEMRGALGRSDAAALARHAHTLGGSMRHFDAPLAIGRARALELRAGAGELGDACALIDELALAVEPLIEALSRFLREGRGEIR